MPIPVQEFEKQVFLSATHFTSSLFLGAARYDTRQFPTFALAKLDAELRCGTHGRTPLVYAVNAAGRSVLLERTQWTVWCSLAKEHNK